MCESLHIGINNYAILKNEEVFSQVKNSHKEAKEYYKFFKEELKYHHVNIITDEEIN